MKVLIKKLNPDVKIPNYKTLGASGVDLHAFLDKVIEIKPQEKIIIPTGISLAIPNDFEIQIRPRSGLAAKSSISVLNTPGTIKNNWKWKLNQPLEEIEENMSIFSKLGHDSGRIRN